MTRNREWLLGLAIVACTLILIFILVSIVSQRQAYDGPTLASRGDKIAIVELSGPIYGTRHLVNQFETYGKNRSVKAIVFRIDSPGGGVAASQEIYEAVRRVRDSGKPVVASMGTVAASGGYYVACGADTIMALPGTTTGSIGVIAQFPVMPELMRKIGFTFETIKSGTYKDTGSPHRNITQAERTMLQNWVNDAHMQFVDVVAKERGLEISRVRFLADGRVFTGRMAKERGLVDLLGDYEAAIELAAEMGAISGEPVLIRERRRQATLFDLLFQQMKSLLSNMGTASLEYR